MCSGDSRGAAPPRTPTRKGSRCHQMETISASHLPEFTRVLEFTSQVPGSRISNALAHPLSDSTCTMILRGGVISFTLQPCLSEPGLGSMPLQLIALFVMAPCPLPSQGEGDKEKGPWEQTPPITSPPLTPGHPPAPRGRRCLGWRPQRSSLGRGLPSPCPRLCPPKPGESGPERKGQKHSSVTYTEASLPSLPVQPLSVPSEVQEDSATESTPEHHRKQLNS